MSHILDKIVLILPLLLLLRFTKPTECVKTGLVIRQGLRRYNDLIAIGASNFSELKQNSKIFIDNSMLIRDLIDMGSHPQTILWQGPNDWGKTMNMDMIKMFFEMRFDQNGDVIPKEFTENFRYFAKGEIAVDEATFQRLETPPLIAHEKYKNGTSYIEYMGRNPVIHVSFKHVDGPNPETMKQQIKSAISRAFKDYEFLAHHSTPSHFNNYLQEKDWKRIGYSIRHLCEKLSAHVNRSESVIVLIDDFDTPIRNLFNFIYPWQLQDSEFDISFQRILEIFTALQGIFTHTVHHETGKSCMHRAIFTSKFKLEPHFYDNEFFLLDKDESMDEYFGFSEEHVRRVFETHGIAEELAEKALTFYGIHKFTNSNLRFYSPGTIAKFLHKKTLDTPNCRYYDITPTIFMFKSMFESKNLRANDPAWFPKIELFLFTLFTNNPIDVESAGILPFHYIDTVANLYNRLRNNRRQGYDDTHYKEIFLTFLLADGYLTKIPNTNLAKWLNIEMAASFGKFVDSYYTDYCPNSRQKQIAELIPILAEFIESNLANTSRLENVLADVHNVGNSSEIYGMETWDEHFYLLRIYTLRTMLRLKFNIDVHYQKEPTADLVIFNKKNRQVVILKLFDPRKKTSLKVPENVFDSSKRTIKLIGIHVTYEKRPQVFIRIV